MVRRRTDREQPVIFRENSREGESTIKYDLTTSAPGFSKLQAGATFKIFRVNYDTASPLGFDSPYSLVTGATHSICAASSLRIKVGPMCRQAPL
jgi:hypothetical protein